MVVSLGEGRIYFGVLSSLVNVNFSDFSYHLPRNFLLNGIFDFANVN